MTADIDGWIDLADVIMGCPDQATAGRLAASLPLLGLTGDERHALGEAIAGRTDPAGQFLHRLAGNAPHLPEQRPHSGSHVTDETAMERAMEVADRVEAEPTMLQGPEQQDVLRVLEALPAHRVGTLVQQLISRHDLAAHQAAVAIAERAPMSRLPVEDLIGRAHDLSESDLAVLAEVLDHAPRGRVMQGLAAALSSSPRPSMARLVELLADRQRRHAAVGAEPPPVASSPVFPQAPHVPLPKALPNEPVYRGASPGSGAQPGDDEEVGGTTAYPRLDLRTGTARPDVVVVDRPFTVIVGLGPRPSPGIVSSGALSVQGPVDVVLTYDPDSLQLDGAGRRTLHATAADPYPTVGVTVTARYLSDPPETRRIGAHYLVGTQVVGVAWRRFVAVDEEPLVDGAPAPPASERTRLDLGPLLGQDAPDLVLAVCRADTGSGDRWVWSTYAADPALPVTDAPDVATLDGEVAEFATATRRGIQFSTNAYSDYLTLAGRAHRIGSSVPAAVHTALRATLEAARSRGQNAAAPTVLLLTEELLIPWELAAISPPVTTPWGGSSPFLGAHVAIGRWPLTDRRPQPVPRTSVDVRAAAVVTADYTGVPGWGRLEAALAEADEVSALFQPPAVRVEPDLVQVIDLLRGIPPADLLHMALHGQFDQEGEQEGIVLLERSPGGVARPQFLTPVQLETGTLPSGPFVFLNACQVGADERVLGVYGGFASTLLRVGASGVVAPLWNIEDAIAADVAREVYAATLGPPEDGEHAPVSVAEAFRQVRARYTEDAVRAGTPGVTATLIAFQVFGHPRLRLHRAP